MRIVMAQLRLTARWLAELKYLAFGFVFVGLAFALIYSFQATEQSVRLAGLGLQVIGIATIIWEILVARESFGHPRVADMIVAWFRRCPLARRAAHLAPEGVQVTAEVTGGRLVAMFQPKADLTMEQKVEHLQRGLLTIQNRIAQAESEMDRKFRSAEAALAKNARELRQAHDGILKTIEEVSTRDMYIAAIGALWLFVGVILSTAASEVAGLMR